MIAKLHPRPASALLVFALLLVPACEPDECDLDLTYSVEGVGDFQYVWRHPSTTCSLANYGMVGASIQYNLDNSRFDIQIVDGFSVGVHDVDITYTDELGTTWYSGLIGQGTFDSGCIANITNVELVDWVSDDHYRVRGIVSCAGPLVDTQFTDQISGANQLQLTDVKFNIYAGQYGY